MFGPPSLLRFFWNSGSISLLWWNSNVNYSMYLFICFLLLKSSSFLTQFFFQCYWNHSAYRGNFCIMLLKWFSLTETIFVVMLLKSFSFLTFYFFFILLKSFSLLTTQSLFSSYWNHLAYWGNFSCHATEII